MKEGGLLSLSELQLVVPPRYALVDKVPATAPLLLVCLKRRQAKSSLEASALPKEKLSDAGSVLPLEGEAPIEVFAVNHPSACNASILSTTVEQCGCVLIHNRSRAGAR